MKIPFEGAISTEIQRKDSKKLQNSHFPILKCEIWGGWTRAMFRGFQKWRRTMCLWFMGEEKESIGGRGGEGELPLLPLPNLLFITQVAMVIRPFKI